MQAEPSERTDFEEQPDAAGTGTITDNISRAQDSFEEDKTFDDESSDYVPKTNEQVADEIDGVIGGLLRKQQTFTQVSKGKKTSPLEKKLMAELAKI